MQFILLSFFCLIFLCAFFMNVISLILLSLLLNKHQTIEVLDKIKWFEYITHALEETLIDSESRLFRRRGKVNMC